MKKNIALLLSCCISMYVLPRVEFTVGNTQRRADALGLRLFQDSLRSHRLKKDESHHEFTLGYGGFHKKRTTDFVEFTSHFDRSDIGLAYRFENNSFFVNTSLQLGQEVYKQDPYILSSELNDNMQSKFRFEYAHRYGKQNRQDRGYHHYSRTYTIGAPEIMCGFKGQLYDAWNISYLASLSTDNRIEVDHFSSSYETPLLVKTPSLFLYDNFMQENRGGMYYEPFTSSSLQCSFGVDATRRLFNGDTNFLDITLSGAIYFGAPYTQTIVLLFAERDDVSIDPSVSYDSQGHPTIHQDFIARSSPNESFGPRFSDLAPSFTMARCEMMGRLGNKLGINMVYKYHNWLMTLGGNVAIVQGERVVSHTLTNNEQEHVRDSALVDYAAVGDDVVEQGLPDSRDARAALSGKTRYYTYQPHGLKGNTPQTGWSVISSIAYCFENGSQFGVALSTSSPQIAFSDNGDFTVGASIGLVCNF